MIYISDSESDYEIEVPFHERYRRVAYDKVKFDLHLLKNDKKKYAAIQTRKEEEKRVLEVLIQSNIVYYNDEDSDGEVEVNLDSWINATHDKLTEEINELKEYKRRIEISQRNKQEDKRLLKIMLLGKKTNIVQYPTKWTLVSKPKYYRFVLLDKTNNCYVYITDLTGQRKNKFFITVKILMGQIKLVVKKYEKIVPLQVLNYVIRLILEKRIKTLLDGRTEKIKYRALMQLYRETYPVDDDKEFVKTTICDVWLGKYNDPVDSDWDLSKGRHITLEDIISGSGVWQIIPVKIESEENIDGSDEGAIEQAQGNDSSTDKDSAAI